jgi:tetratricopeptide (TPR) repeat protein
MGVEASSTKFRRRPTPPETVLFRWIVGTILAVVVLGISAVLLYPKAKVIRGRIHAAESARLLAAGNPSGAVRSIRLALRFAPEDPEVLRGAAEYCRSTGLRDGLQYYSLLSAATSLTAEDRRGYAELALFLQRPDIATAELGRLLAGATNDPALWRLMARARDEDRDLPGALAAARRAVALRPDDDANLVTLGALLIRPGLPAADQAEGRRLLFGVAASRGRLQSAAAGMLAERSEVSRGEASAILLALESRTNATISEKTVEALLRARLSPEQSNAIVLSSVRQLGGRADGADLVVLGGWALAHGGAAALPEIIGSAAARTNLLLREYRILGLDTAGRHDQAAAALEGTDGTVPAWFRSWVLGRIAMAMGKMAEAVQDWSNAIDAAEPSAGELEPLAVELEQSDHKLLALSAWQKLARNPQSAITASINALRVAQDLDDIHAACRAVRQLSLTLPEDDLLAGERAWMELAANENSAAAKRIVQRLRAKFPKDPRWLCAEALVLWRTGDPAAGLDLVENAPASIRSGGECAAAYAALLGANRRVDAARKIARLLKPSDLSSAGRALIDPWR